MSGLQVPTLRQIGRILALLWLPWLLAGAARAELAGHGGPVRALAIAPDGLTAVSGSFDTTAIIWDLATGRPATVLRFHEGAVNGVLLLGQGAMTAADDGRIALFVPGRDAPVRVIGTRGAPVLALAPGAASIHADRTFRIMGETVATFAEAPSALAAVGDGHVIATADQSLRWHPSGRMMTLPAGATALAGLPEGALLVGGADGALRIVTAEGALGRTLAAQDSPIIALAVSADGRRAAAGGLRGAVVILDIASGQVLARLVGPGLPVWSLAFHPDGRTLFTGGADGMVRRWDIATGEPAQPAFAPRPDFPQGAMAERGAQVFRACAVCHTVTPDGGNRAGPTLHGVFGRPIGTRPDYLYSPGFAAHGIVWNAETIARLFRDGPAVVTPGTKMPEQRITDEEDLAALVEWLARVTR
jgi:cytochrome c